MAENMSLLNSKLDFYMDFSRMNYSLEDLKIVKDRIPSVHAEMQKIESGEIKNPDENRQVTHFTDRISYPKEQLFQDVVDFSEDIRSGKIKGSTGKKIEHVIINGIGGSALGPQLMQFAVNGPYWNELTEEKRNGYPRIYFLDNTDSAGVSDVLYAVDLEKTLMVNISKSGGTQETKNNIIGIAEEYEKAGLEYAKHACCITMEGSQLDEKAHSENWLKIFPMAESIGGRTSETSIVGHLPAALAGIDFASFIQGAADMDVWTRELNLEDNPAYMLAAMWYLAGNGKGNKNMVIVPYSDRLVLLSRYFQQLVMESLGKEKDLDGKTVHQGLNVFGNKGGTDAHAFIQQLNDGRNDFFATFIEVLKDSKVIPISKGITMGDYLHGFQVGLVNALSSGNRQVIQIQLKEINASSLGMIIALYERAVAAYAELINVNAFHQPGVQAYKLASNNVIQLILDLQVKLKEIAPWTGNANDLCNSLALDADENEVCGILSKFAENLDNRKFDGFSISRVSNENSRWIYKVEKA
ncbi:MAG: glucose-6-phosphate isomerase [bacterium]|nr:glucose-6-phosphate isomerase [bacterium]